MALDLDTRVVAPARVKRSLSKGRIALWGVTALVFAFLLVPIATVIVFSFNSKKSLSSLGHPSLTWYSTLFHDQAMVSSIYESLRIAGITAVSATIIGTVLAFGLARARTKWSAPTNVVLIATLVTPEIATAFALFLLYTSGLNMVLSQTTVTLSHITFSIVYVTLVVRTRIAGLRTDIEEAARDLGCTELGVLRLVVLPQLLPAVVGAALLVFVLSFDDFVTSMFTTGVGTSPLPVFLYSTIKFGLSPEINAVGSLMLALTLTAGGLGVFLMRLASRRSEGK